MTIENLKYFFLAILISLPFWWGVNIFGQNLEEVFFLDEISKNPQILAAQLNIEQFRKIKKTPEPLKKEEIENFQIKTEAAISVWLDSEIGQPSSREISLLDKEKVLFEKEAEKVLPIASLTKLMTAHVVLEYYPDFSQIVEISREAVFQHGDLGNLKVGEKLTIENLLYIMLIESSNDAAYALSEVIGEKAFVDLMNIEAKYLGMEKTFFVDPMGISPENRSSAKDLVVLTKYLLEKPLPGSEISLPPGLPRSEISLPRDLIWQIIGMKEYDLYTLDGIFHHRLRNTNELLGEIPEIIGGKTGYLFEAKGCFLTILETPKRGYIINVILGSEDRFEEMQQLLNWLSESYQYIF